MVIPQDERAASALRRDKKRRERMMSLHTYPRVESPWDSQDAESIRSERMVSALTTHLPPDTTVVELQRAVASGHYPHEVPYVRRLDVAHISDTGWVDFYTGQVNDSGRDAFRHISLSGSDMETLCIAYFAQHRDVLDRVRVALPMAATFAADLDRDFPDLDADGKCGDPGCRWCGDGSNSILHPSPDHLCQECGQILDKTEDGICTTCGELAIS